MKNKKGSAVSIIAIVVTLFTLALLFFVVNFVAKTFVSNILAVPMINATSPTAPIAFNGMSTTVDRFDYLFLGVFIGLIFALMISSWLLGSEPIFIFFYLLVIGIGIPLSAIMANAWDDLGNNVIFGTTINSFPITNHIITYLPFYVIGIGILGMVIIFMKPFVQKGL